MEILIADDSKMIRYMTLEVLHALGYNSISEAANVAEARTHMQRKKFDLIISDFHMPGETGLDFLRYVRATPEFSKIPFILLTTDGEKKNIVAAVQAGVQAYLFKPVQKIALAQKLTDLSKKFNFQPPNIVLSSTNSQISTESHSAHSLASYVTDLVPRKSGFSFDVTNYGLHSVETFIGKDMAEAFPATVLEKFPGARYVLICDQQSQAKSKDILDKWNQELGCFSVVIPDIATNKTYSQCSTIIDKLAAEGIDSSAVIIGFGNASVLDIAGFVAASYLGGIAFLVVPLSIGAFLDASVGAVRTVHGSQAKNLAAFPYDASLVWFDITDFITQADATYVYDCIEMLRYAFFGGSDMLEAITKTWDKVIKKEEAAVIELARMCFAARVSVRSLNISDTSKDAMLKFAQPITEALLVHQSKTPLHSGQALCKGILCMFDISNRAGTTVRASVPAFVELLKRMSLFKLADVVDCNAVYESAFNANPLKKAPCLALVREPGSVVFQENLAESLLHESLANVLNPPTEAKK